MPARGARNLGGQPVTGAVVQWRQQLALAGGAVGTSAPINVLGMSRVVYWIRQTVGAVGATVEYQFSVSDAVGILTPVPEWLPTVAPFVLIPPPASTPTLNDYALPAKFLRIQVTAPVGQATTVDLVIGGVL